MLCCVAYGHAYGPLTSRGGCAKIYAEVIVTCKGIVERFTLLYLILKLREWPHPLFTQGNVAFHWRKTLLIKAIVISILS